MKKEANVSIRDDVDMTFQHFLISSNLITRHEMLRAVADQKAMQEPIGKLALSHGMLNIKQVFEVLNLQAEIQFENRSDKTTPYFGEVAVILGILSESDVEHLLRLQESSVPSIGEMLVKAGSLSASGLRHAEVEFRRSQRTLLQK